jgi:hypothetical protein
MTKKYSFKITGKKLTFIMNKILEKYTHNTTNESHIHNGQFSAYLSQESEYTIQIVDYEGMKDEYGFSYFNRIDIKNDDVFKKWYKLNTDYLNFGDWVSWRATKFRCIILEILDLIKK